MGQKNGHIGLLIFMVAAMAVASQCWGAWDKTKPVSTDDPADFPAVCRANWEAIELGTDSALQITNAKVASTAAIADTKLAQITTAGKVSAAAITSLSSTPAGAGVLPDANAPGKLKADSSDTTPQYLDSLINTSQMEITAGDLLQIKSAGITATEIGTAAVGADEIASDAVGSAEIADDAIYANHIFAGQVGAAEIADLAVGEGEINTGAVTESKLGTGAVTEGKIAATAVPIDKMKNAALAKTSDVLGYATVAALSYTDVEIETGIAFGQGKSRFYWPCIWIAADADGTGGPLRCEIVIKDEGAGGTFGTYLRIHNDHATAQEYAGFAVYQVDGT